MISFFCCCMNTNVLRFYDVTLLFDSQLQAHSKYCKMLKIILHVVA